MPKVLLSRQAARYLEKAPTRLAERIEAALNQLEGDPNPLGCKPLKGRLEGLWRLRIGSIRMVYEVFEDPDEIRIVRIGPRGII